MSRPLPTVRILCTELHNVTRPELLARLERGAVFTPNVDIIMKQVRDPAYRALFHEAEFRICDSEVLRMAARFLGTPIKEKISGSDFLFEFCEHHRSSSEFRMFLLGAAPGVAERQRIRDSGAGSVAVALGAPKQERWILANRDQLPEVRVFFGIGATVDFEAGLVPRAPTWMSRNGLEWFWRLAREPRRLWKRYLVDDLPFFWLLLRQRLGLYKG